MEKKSFQTSSQREPIELVTVLLGTGLQNAALLLQDRLVFKAIYQLETNFKRPDD